MQKRLTEKGLITFLILVITMAKAMFFVATSPNDQKADAATTTITITVKDKIITYGNGLPEFEVSYYPYPDLSKIYGEVNFVCSGGEQPEVGIYDVFIVENSIISSEYDLIFVKGKLEIEPKDLKIYPKSVKMTYGEAMPEFEIVYSGFAYNDTKEDLVGTLEISCDAAEVPNAGSYPIELNGLSSQNYNIRFEAGVLTVNKQNQTKIIDSVVLKEKGAKTVVFEPVEGAEYSKDGGITWQDSATFNDLNPNTTYKFAIRYKESANFKAGAISGITEITTDKVKSQLTIILIIVISSCAAFFALLFLIYKFIKRKKAK